MKFARYLDETQIPEWKRAYIDFKGLKKRIAAIRKGREGGHTVLQHPTDSPNRAAFIPLPEDGNRRQSYGSLDHTPRQVQQITSSPTLDAIPGAEDPRNRTRPGQPSRSWSELVLSRTRSGPDHGLERRPSFSRIFATVARRRSHKAPVRPSTTIESLYASLDPVEAAFFLYLDHELEKVDSFYNDRESEAISKWTEFKDQLRVLQNHRRQFHEAQARDEPWTKFPRALGEALGISGEHIGQPSGLNAEGNSKADTSQPRTPSGTSRDPSEYQHAKRKLKKALQEFYRGLELLNDYRVLNLTGFRKALKKFEKTTRRHPAQDLYMREKINPRRFTFSGTMDDIMREVEDIFAKRFEHGDRKKARRRLKSPHLHKSHHFSTFRSGVYLGIALPALVSAIYQSFQPETRQKIPEWGPLLEIYALLLIPVVFSLLIGINLLVWSRARINFGFIFELDVRSSIDTREYFELPTIMLATLCGAIWLSFFSIGSQHVAPTTWPIIWIGLAVGIMINPLPIFSRSSRYWLIRNVSRLLAPGTSRVEFTDFWMGDQFCSLVFSLGHLFTIGCAYSNDWHNVWAHCNSAMHWPVPFALTSLPSFVRLVQSIRRYYDSRLPTHLVNAGKYLSSIVAYAAYYVWRVRGSQHNYTFVLWCVFATCSSIYTSSWDLTMDWSFLKSHSPHPFLRPELVYTNNVLPYYFAIVSNILVRFIWIIYIPTGGLSNRIRAFIAAALEMLRRFQWNFYRLENEQIGNTDQYRATREVPLPYSARQADADDDEESDLEGDDAEPNKATRAYRHRGSMRMSKVSNDIRSGDEEDVTPKRVDEVFVPN